MFQVRIHGRGGQGVVSAAEMLSVAAFLEGKHAQAFPSFGSERMGAPVMAFWLASPSMDPEILLMSAGVVGWELALWRLGCVPKGVVRSAPGLAGLADSSSNGPGCRAAPA